MNDNTRPTRYDENFINSQGSSRGKGFPLIILLLIAGGLAYAINLGGIRGPQTTQKTVSVTQPTPTVCPTLYNGPQSIVEDGRLILITPTPHPCQANQIPVIDITTTPEISPSTTDTPVPTLGL